MQFKQMFGTAVCVLFLLKQINESFLENLGLTSGEYPIYKQNLGWSAKSKIPDRLRFSRHMKTRLLMQSSHYN